MSRAAVLALEDGSIFRGVAIGAEGQIVGEVIFNTAMTGYQEILTDPSYTQQIITFTYPHIGNVGMNSDDQESPRVWSAGLVIRDLAQLPSNWRCQKTLQEYLKENNVVGISEVDTRRLTRILRDKGAQRGCISTEIGNLDNLVHLAREFPGLNNLDLAKKVSVTQPYEWKESSWQAEATSKNLKSDFHVVVYDFGVKQNILRLLVDRGCRVTVVPAETSAQEVLAYHPHGILLSNGPGDPAACDYAILAIRELLEAGIPLFGICLGFQLLALACGAKTEKMKFGHHGANHPVFDLITKRVMVTSQNHGFAVVEATLPACLQVTHRSLFDNTIQGIRHQQKPAIGFQGHPEASPGPHDVVNLFDEFVNLMVKDQSFQGNSH